MVKNIGRILMSAGLCTLILLLSGKVFAQDIQIVDVRRNIPLADDAPIYKDFYLNAGSEAGLKKNQVVTVFRKLTIRDSSGLVSYGELTIPVGQLKIVAAQNKVSVAREHKLISRDEEPMLEQIGLMSGDQIILGN